MMFVLLNLLFQIKFEKFKGNPRLDVFNNLILKISTLFMIYDKKNYNLSNDINIKREQVINDININIRS